MAVDTPNDADNVFGRVRRLVHYDHVIIYFLFLEVKLMMMALMRVFAYAPALGGDLTFFKVERTDGSAMPYIDVLACGNGQYGGLGNAGFSNGQSAPVRTRNVSGLLECTFRFPSFRSCLAVWLCWCKTNCIPSRAVSKLYTRQIAKRRITCSLYTRTTSPSHPTATFS